MTKTGYNKYFLLNGKTMKVENFSLQDAKVKKGTTGELKRIFCSSMKNRITSRVVLNKFIQEVGLSGSTTVIVTIILWVAKSNQYDRIYV